MDFFELSTLNSQSLKDLALSSVFHVFASILMMGPFSDDIWIVSAGLEFDPSMSFVARSTFYGPSSSLEVEIEPLTGFCPSNWQNGCNKTHCFGCCIDTNKNEL